MEASWPYAYAANAQVVIGLFLLEFIISNTFSWKYQILLSNDACSIIYPIHPLQFEMGKCEMLYCEIASFSLSTPNIGVSIVSLL